MIVFSCNAKHINGSRRTVKISHATQKILPENKAEKRSPETEANIQ